MDPTLPNTIPSNVIKLFKTPSDLPDDLLLPILAHVPLNRRSLRNLRLVGKRFNDITHTQAFYRRVARTQFPDINPLFFVKPDENNLIRTRILQREIDRSISGVMRGIRLDDDAIVRTLQSVVKKGIALIWWLGHHAIESPSNSTVGSSLLELAQKEQLDFAAMFTIRIAIICMFEGIQKPAKLEIIQWNRRYMFFSRAPADGHDFDRLFLAFESAILWTKKVRKSKPGERLQMCSEDYMRDTFGAMIDVSGLAALHMKNNADNAASVSEPWTVFPALLKDNASSCQSLKELLGSDFDTLTDIKLYRRIKDVMKREALSEDVLKWLNLEKIGQNACLSGTTFEFPSLWYWRV